MIRLSLRRRNKQLKSIVLRYDWSSLTNSDISKKYMVTVRNKFDTFQEIAERHTPNVEYENFVTTYIEAAVECIYISNQKVYVKFDGVNCS